MSTDERDVPGGDAVSAILNGVAPDMSVLPLGESGLYRVSNEDFESPSHLLLEIDAGMLEEWLRYLPEQDPSLARLAPGAKERLWFLRLWISEILAYPRPGPLRAGLRRTASGLVAWYEDIPVGDSEPIIEGQGRYWTAERHPGPTSGAGSD